VLSAARALPLARPGPWDVWHRNATVWRRTWKTSLVGSIGEPLLYFLGFGIGLGTLIPSVGGLPYLHYVAPGLMLSSVMYSATIESTYGTFTKMEHQKVYASMILSPLTFSDIVLGEILWAMTKGLISGGTILLLCLAAGIGTTWPGLLCILLVLFAGLVFSSLGLIATSLARGYDSFNYYFTLFIAPMFFFSGIFFPLKRLPPPLEQLAWLFPLAHMVNLSRALMQDHLSANLMGECAWLVFFAAGTILLALRLMSRRFMP
jgi:lipooligosaccharide transport system permease protein